VLVDEIDASVVFYGTPSAELARMQELRKPLQAHFGELDNLPNFSDPVRKTPFWSQFYIIKTIILPRQAQDKHRESTQKRRRFVQAAVDQLESLLQSAAGYSEVHRQENAVFAMPFYSKSHHLTKTGSGQT
jgi:hypothetical protein